MTPQELGKRAQIPRSSTARSLHPQAPWPPSRTNRGITPEDGNGDPEFSARPATNALAALDLWARRRRPARRHSCSTLKRRAPGIRELSSADVVDTWLLKVNPCRGSILHADEFVDAVRFRLGCAGPVQPAVCPACNTGLLDTLAPAAR